MFCSVGRMPFPETTSGEKPWWGVRLLLEAECRQVSGKSIWGIILVHMGGRQVAGAVNWAHLEVEIKSASWDEAWGSDPDRDLTSLGIFWCFNSRVLWEQQSGNIIYEHLAMEKVHAQVRGKPVNKRVVAWGARGLWFWWSAHFQQGPSPGCRCVCVCWWLGVGRDKVGVGMSRR